MLRVHADYKETKVQQIVTYLTGGIEKGMLKKDSRLPSINEFSNKYSVARDTVERAYKELKKDGYITSRAGKGFFVKGKKDSGLKILLVFNELSSYKKLLYDSFINTIGEKATVDLQFHHYDPCLLERIIERNSGNYHYYVIMPHFFHNCSKEQYLKVLNRIPPDELMLLDKAVAGFTDGVKNVVQDFAGDMYNGLVSAKDLLEKYERLTIVYPTHTNYPLETLQGTERFCDEYKMDFAVSSNPGIDTIRKGTVYMVNVESDLAQLIKKVRESNFTLGKDIGLISFNETVLKELLDITVLTADFEFMGRCAATMLLEGKCEQVNIPHTLIRRKSV
jgi:DNA-binding transcriptional regulator YhcF (GntR family)